MGNNPRASSARPEVAVRSRAPHGEHGGCTTAGAARSDRLHFHTASLGLISSLDLSLPRVEKGEENALTLLNSNPFGQSQPRRGPAGEGELRKVVAVKKLVRFRGEGDFTHHTKWELAECPE